jgi:quinol monooxygenase YgiN
MSFLKHRKKETTMVVSVTRFTLAPEKFDELQKFWDPLLKEAQKQKGMQKALLLTSHDGDCLAFGFWDSFENAKAWGDTSFYRDFVQSLGKLVSGKTERHVYSVRSGDLSGILEAKKAA